MSATTPSAERQRLIEKHMPFARAFAVGASKNLPLELEDAIQFAYEGLIKAVNRYDPSMYDSSHASGASSDWHFKSFARRHIFGTLIDEARRATFVKRRGLEKGLRMYMASLDEIREDENGHEIPAVQLESIPADLDLLIDFEDAFEQLTDKERHILLASGAGVTGKELAEEYGVTASRVSQIKVEAKNKLEELMYV